MKTTILAPLLTAAFLPWPFSSEESPTVKMELRGDAAAISDRCVQLTPDSQWARGSVWALAPVDLGQPLDIQMSLSFGDRDALGADGIVFVLSPHRGTGIRGEGLGYGGLRESIGLELDTYQNRRENDPAADHLALLTDGSPYHFDPARVVELPNLEDGRTHTLRIQWRPQSDELNVSLDGRLTATYPGAVVRAHLGDGAQVYWGVTASTGRKANPHQVCIDAPPS